MAVPLSSKSAAQPDHSFLSNDRIRATGKENRWLQVLPSVSAHLCLGAPYAWSVFNAPLTKELGVVASATDDWSLSSVVPVVSAVFAVQGLSAAMLGKYMENWSPRLNGLLSAVSFGGGFALGGLGVYLHNLPLLYLGYGFLGGLGIGLGYVPAVKNLMGWFPDRSGFASGVTIMGFGGAALLAAPFSEALMRMFARAPTYLGPSSSLELVTHLGKRYAVDPTTGNRVPVVIANSSDLAATHFTGLSEGAYVVGTGSTGVAETLGVFGGAYFIAMSLSALSYRVAPVGYAPAGWTRPNTSEKGVSTYVPIDNVMKTPQFWSMFTMLGCLASAGLAVASVAKTMMADIFGAGLPAVVTAGFASGYVMSLSVANLSGRLIWSSVSDTIGRRNMFMIMTFSSIPLYLVMPFLAAHSDSVTALGLFYGASFLSFSFFGAAYSLMPAFEGDTFGTKAITATHGRMLLASSLAAVAGPSVIVKLRARSEVNAIRDLSSLCDPNVFANKFGAPVTALDQLIESKSVTISKLMQIVPPGTIDPTPYLYNNTMYLAAGIMSVAAVATLLHRPVDPKFLVVDSLPGPALPQSVSAREFVVGVDGSDASESAFAWALTQCKPGVDRISPVAIIPGSDINEAPALLHRFVLAAKERGIAVTPLFTSSKAIGSALAAVAQNKRPYALVLGKNVNHSDLAAFTVQQVPAPLIAFVAPNPQLSLPSFESTPVRTDVTWDQLMETDGSIYEARKTIRK